MKFKIKHTITFLIPALALSLVLPSFTMAQSMSTTSATNSNPSLDASVPGVASISWPTIEAKSAFVYNPVSNQIIYEKNADVQRPMASLVKIMTAFTAEHILALYPSLAEKKLAIVKMKDEAPVDFSLPMGSTWLPDPLVQIMLLGSSNKAAETVGSQLVPRASFVSLMNFYAKQTGLTRTYFRNPSGLTESTQPNLLADDRLDIAGGVSTAREVARMMWSVIAQAPGLLDITKEESLSILSPKTSTNPKGITVITNTNKLLKEFPIVFGKTGFTANAGGNIALVMQKSVTSQPYIIVVLGSTMDKRFEDAAKLASTTLKFMDLQSVK